MKAYPRPSLKRRAKEVSGRAAGQNRPAGDQDKITP